MKLSAAERRLKLVNRSVWIAALAVAVAVAAIAVGVRLEHVHDTYGVWQLAATDTPDRITAFGRDFDRSDLKPLRSAPLDLVERRETVGGGTLLVPSRASGVPVVVYLRDHEGQVWVYGLVGGP